MATFSTPKDYTRFIKTLKYYQIANPKPRFSLFHRSTSSLDKNPKIVEIISYCLMPNHFHFLVKQKWDNGITEFTSKITNSYTKYFNIKNRRFGPLFQGEFKAVHIESNEQILHLSRYIHLNPLVGHKTNNLDSYQWSSYREYLGFNNNICGKKIILEQFQSPANYKQFVLDQKEYGESLERIKHQLLDNPQVHSYFTPRV